MAHDPVKRLESLESSVAVETRSQLWVWWVCGLLLLASTINYMDRQTLSNMSTRIKNEFGMTKLEYGWVEAAFSLAFAVGASLFGLIADKTSVRWLYPIVLILWSTMGFLTGFVQGFASLLLCRLLLGLFEAGHWPCALKTTQRLLPRENRALGNSVLQSGTAIGAMITPLIIGMMVTDKPGSWRLPFQIVGAIGSLWAVLWLLTIRKDDLKPPDEQSSSPTDGSQDSTAGPHEGSSPGSSFLDVVFSRRFLVLVIVVISINLFWHQFRAWMVMFLEEGRGYTNKQALSMSFWFNVMTDIGCLGAGLLTATLCKYRWSVHSARCLVFCGCSLLVAAGAFIPLLASGWMLNTALLTVGLGALGLFPCYYSFTQELSTTHQGKVSGTLGTIAWVFPAPWHLIFGAYVDKYKTYDLGMVLASLFPLIACFALLVLWPKEADDAKATT